MVNEAENKQDILKIRHRLDTILEENIRKLDSIGILGGKLHFSLTILACLYLIVEREEEVKGQSDVEQKRYTRTSFLNDVSELGLEIDDDLMASLESIIHKKYVAVDAEGRYHSQDVAADAVNNLNRIFPGMPGMNLVAYIVQTIDEIVSGRKKMEVAEEQFDKALVYRGRPITFTHLRTISKSAEAKAEEYARQEAIRQESKKASDGMKRIFSKKLLELRETIAPENDDFTLVTKRILSPDAITIKEISPHRIREQKEREERERLEREERIREQQERERLERERQEEERRRIEQEEADRLAREKLLKEQEEAERLEREALLNAAREEELLEKERLAREKLEQELEQLRKEKEERDQLEAERLEKENLEQKRLEEERSIAEQIAAFEEDLSVSCPVCNTGSVKAQETEGGKQYFKCSDPRCKFVSWSKPYHFSCPACKGPFLVEFATEIGLPGLKCPRAACSYIQNNLDDPMLNRPVAADVPPADAPPKKKRLVRRRRKT